MAIAAATSARTYVAMHKNALTSGQVLAKYSFAAPQHGSAAAYFSAILAA
jgi:hypothetical protein